MARYSSATILIVSTAIATAAAAETWQVGSGSEVVFTSKAPMESFDGKTQQVRGHVTCDPASLVGPVDLRIEVDLASLDTGIGMRNTHMRERHLQTDRYPLAVFTGEAVTAASSPGLVLGQPVDVTVKGTFDLHGVARPLEVVVSTVLATDGVLTATTAFPVKLSDHAIDRPQFLVMKLADEQQVAVRLVARREVP
ncbi:MAG TPA: YceI family protein [Candidatus Krumholzibacteria bacterium]|nr:YceI family protein [Candidatus Krumholzibacteria bacterium]HPD70408.1 YceI family protein [Candidatus Krumholzibacteria bacterium]HRY39892.1 YceI family protein [Candidatus Krumholzibacteria bacterium]